MRTGVSSVWFRLLSVSPGHLVPVVSQLPLLQSLQDHCDQMTQNIAPHLVSFEDLTWSTTLLCGICFISVTSVSCFSELEFLCLNCIFSLHVLFRCSPSFFPKGLLSSQMYQALFNISHAIPIQCLLIPQLRVFAELCFLNYKNIKCNKVFSLNYVFSCAVLPYPCSFFKNHQLSTWLWESTMRQGYSYLHLDATRPCRYKSWHHLKALHVFHLDQRHCHPHKCLIRSLRASRRK